MRLSFGLIFCSIVFMSFIQLGADYKRNVSKKDVQIHIPKGFPKPIYNFKNNPITPAGFTLGRKLFYDEILSRDSSVSCHTCHQSVAAFAHIDHTLSHGIDGRIGTRNVPPIQNLIWREAFMWDGGINHLEVQAIHPITSQLEMDETLNNVIRKLQSNTEYQQLFLHAFKDTIINSERMLKALTQFTGLMISANSKYDKYMRGEDSFSVQEKNGLSLFRQKCASCHREPLFTDNSYRNNGIGIDTFLHDLGRGKITGYRGDNYKFRVPSLRNVKITYPYMHDGRYRKLYDVLKHYDNSSTFSPDVDEDVKKIGTISDNEKIDIIAFLLTLTDIDFIQDKRFSNPNHKY